VTIVGVETLKNVEFCYFAAFVCFPVKFPLFPGYLLRQLFATPVQSFKCTPDAFMPSSAKKRTTANTHTRVACCLHAFCFGQ